MPIARMFTIVVIKFIDPAIDEIPAKCKLKIAKSTARPCWPISDRGGYKVHPVPTPPSVTDEVTRSAKEGTNNQKLKLFRRGNAMSPVPTNNGRNKFPNPPSRIGMTIKKIIIIAWAVINELYNWPLPSRYAEVGEFSSMRITTE